MTRQISAARQDVLSMIWHVGEITNAVRTALQSHAREADEEQAVYGIDALDELGLHPLIQSGLRAAGYGVHPEQRYPSDRTSSSRSVGKRCDVVLTPDGRPLADPQAERTLFADTYAVGLEGAYWLEIKCVGQFTTDGPFPRYSAELLAPVSRDLRKLSADPLIYHAGLLLILFTADRTTAEHDLTAWYDRCVLKGYPIAPTTPDGFAMTDRLGNGWCAIATYPIRRL